MLQMARHFEDLPKTSMKTTVEFMHHLIGSEYHAEQLEIEDAWIYDPKDLVSLSLSEDTTMEYLIGALLELCTKLVSQRLSQDVVRIYDEETDTKNLSAGRAARSILHQNKAHP
jgi:hypothetical protein